MLNINTHPSYAELRTVRAEMRGRGERFLSGQVLAETLTHYSERGTEYDALHTIMRVNHLQPTDEAVLVGDAEWHIYPASDAE